MFDDRDNTMGLPCWEDGWCTSGWGSGGGTYGGGSPGGMTSPPFNGYQGGYNTVGTGNTTTATPAQTTPPPATPIHQPPGAITTPPPGTQPTPQIFAGIDNKTLLIIGAGLLGVIVLTR